MKDIINQLQEWKENITYDIGQEWNTDKFNNLKQVMYLEQAIALLSHVGKNENNIPE